jgi:hypothetical protein
MNRSGILKESVIAVSKTGKKWLPISHYGLRAYDNISFKNF